jgi:hypothetical protein
MRSSRDGLIRPALTCFEDWTGRWTHLHIRTRLLSLRSIAVKATCDESVWHLTEAIEGLTQLSTQNLLSVGLVVGFSMVIHERIMVDVSSAAIVRAFITSMVRRLRLNRRSIVEEHGRTRSKRQSRPALRSLPLTIWIWLLKQSIVYRV